MDIGTTTVVIRLLNLETGELVADASLENPQRFGGSDVMSRIHYDTEHRGKLLRRTLAGYLTHAIEEFPVDPQTIYEVVVVGNSTMRDLFFRQNVYSIGQNPYRSITEIEMAEGKRTTTSLTETGRRCLLPIHPRRASTDCRSSAATSAPMPPRACSRSGWRDEERLVAIMDIGTNTELILGNRHRILAASCPAGPAFEGGAIRLRHARPRRRDRGRAPRTTAGEFDSRRHRRRAPEGICGSGLVDLMSELLRTGQMNEMGRFEDDVDRITIDAANDIYFFESDVNELAQAKGANVAGLHVVFSSFGIPFDDVDVFYLAGGFGRHLKKDASQAHRPDSESARLARSCRSATPPSKARASRSCRWRSETRSKRSCAESNTAGSKRIPTSSTSSSTGVSSSSSSRAIRWRDDRDHRHIPGHRRRSRRNTSGCWDTRATRSSAIARRS